MTISRFAATALFVLLGALASSAQDASSSRPTVVFVCEHGAAKSVLAAAEFERMAKERGLSYLAVSRGTNIDPQLAPSVVKGLLADGLTPGISKPIKVDAKDFPGAVRVVTFGPDLSPFTPKGTAVLDWSATPSTGENYTAARDHVRKELEKLIHQLEAESKRK